MSDIESYLKELKFTTVVDDIDTPEVENEHGMYSVFQMYISQVVKDEVELTINYHYNQEHEKVFDFIEIKIVKNECLPLIFHSLGDLKHYYNLTNIHKKLKIYHQVQCKKMALESMKEGFKMLWYGLGDYIVTKLRIITLKLGGKIDE